MGKYHLRDVFGAFFFGALFIALILKGIERKLVLVEEVSNETDKGREHDGNQGLAPSPQNLRITPKVANAS